MLVKDAVKDDSREGGSEKSLFIKIGFNGYFENLSFNFLILLNKNNVTKLLLHLFVSFPKLLMYSLSINKNVQNVELLTIRDDY